MSFAFTGLKWGTPDYGEDGGTVTWWGDLSSGLSYDTGLYDQSDFDDALEDAFQAWEDVADIDFVEVGSAGASDVDVFMAALSGSTVGQASMVYSPISGVPDPIVSATVRLDSTEGWSPYGSTDLSFYAVALHEIGHVLGLDHVNDTSEIMNPVISTNTLGDGDIGGVQLIYGADSASGPVLAPSGVDPTSFVADDPASDGGGGGGGGGFAFVAVILGVLAALFTGGLGGAAVAFAAQRGHDDDDHDDHDEHHDHVHDFIPITELWDDSPIVDHHDEDDHDHEEDDHLLAMI